MKTAFAFICAAALVACGAPGTSEETADTGTTTATGNTIDLSQFDMPLLVNVPHNGHEPKAVMNEERGRAEVRAGEHFGLIVTEMEPDFARLKADLDRDMLVKNTITQETSDLIVYTSEFPDGTGTFTHFMQVVRSGSRTFVVEDLPDGRFNESDGRAMVGAVIAKPAA
ncbi:MAG: hypothetical protein IPJ76_07820 [Flavobacteriales bacterium]|nr:MAG: hypothetical protein IPJ76_07820 [Flavobacteriales bacterium]